MSAVFPIRFNLFPARRRVLREKVDRLEGEIKKLPQLAMATRHFFADGIYAREITIPKGSVLTGHIHKTTHLNIISKGEISVVTENGVERVKAPCTIVSPPGTKRAGFAHEDTVWTTVLGTDEKDIDRVEALYLAKDHDAYTAFLAASKGE